MIKVEKRHEIYLEIIIQLQKEEIFLLSLEKQLAPTHLITRLAKCFQFSFRTLPYLRRMTKIQYHLFLIINITHDKPILFITGASCISYLTSMHTESNPLTITISQLS